MHAPLLRPHNVTALFALVWLMLAFVLFVQGAPLVSTTLFEPGDAMRLVQLRDWLAGQGWYDLTSRRVEGSFDPGTSRLIDAGLGGLVLALRQIFEASEAERLARAIWPLLWIGPLLGGMTATAWRLAGRPGAMAALAIAVAAVPATPAFQPGRIDHHNVQMALVMLTLAAIVWSDRKPWCATVAGALTGLALAIGFQTLPYLFACGAALALRYAFDRAASAALVRYGLALALSISLSFFVSVGQPQWGRSLCDAIAINSTMAVAVAGLVLAFAGWLAHPHGVTRVMALLGALCLSFALLMLLEPRCLRGPFAMVDPAMWPAWRAGARDLQPLWSLAATQPLATLTLLAFPALAIATAAVLARDPLLRRDAAFWTVAGLLAVACVVTVVAVGAHSYALWSGMPLVAVLVARMVARPMLRGWRPRLAVASLLAAVLLSEGLVGIATAAGWQPREAFRSGCFTTANVATLAALPPGLVIAEPDLGPYILALTPHRVMAVPSHRNAAGAAAVREVMASMPDTARRRLAALKADAIVLCSERVPQGLSDAERRTGLWATLRARRAVEGIEPAAAAGALAIHRIRTAGQP